MDDNQLKKAISKYITTDKTAVNSRVSRFLTPAKRLNCGVVS